MFSELCCTYIDIITVLYYVGKEMMWVICSRGDQFSTLRLRCLDIAHLGLTVSSEICSLSSQVFGTFFPALHFADEENPNPWNKDESRDEWK